MTKERIKKRRREYTFPPSEVRAEVDPGKECGCSSWNDFGFHTCRMHRLSKQFHIKSLRGALITILGPNNWKRAKAESDEQGAKYKGMRQKKILRAHNTGLKVKIGPLAAGVKSKDWGPGDIINVSPKDVVTGKPFKLEGLA